MSLEREEFLRHYEAFRDRIFTFCWYRVGFDRETAEDLTQEVFLRAFRALHTFDRRRPFAPWIFRIARNELADHFRSRGRTLPLDELPELPAPEGADADTRLACERTLRAIHSLPPDDRDLLLLRCVDGLRHREIAAVVGRSTVAVRVAIHRARRALTRALAESPSFPPRRI